MSGLDRQALARDLRAALEGEVRFDTATRALYATDASNYRQPPIGVVLPRSLDDVVATHAVCREHGAPIVPRGCGTSLSGETVNVAVVIDCSKYLTRIGEVDPERRLVSRRARRDQRARRTARPASTASSSGPTLDARLLHDRRQRRQQLLRRALGAGRVPRRRRPHLRQRPLARGPHLRRPAAPRRPDDGRRARADRRRGRPARRDLRGAPRPARPLRRPDPRAVPEDPAPRVGLQPRRPAPGERLRRRARARRHRGHLRHRARGDARA